MNRKIVRMAANAAISGICVIASAGAAQADFNTENKRGTPALEASKAASAESGYAVPGFVEAISSNTIGILRSSDERANTLTSAYLVGFGVTFDRICRFLPATTRESLQATVAAASDLSSRNSIAANFLTAARVGMADSRLYLGEHGCATREAIIAKRNLALYLH
jgi:hypothetical protein